MNLSIPARIWVSNQKEFSTERRCAIRHSFDAHPLMQLDALQALAEALFKTRQCRFIDRHTNQATKFNHVGGTLDGRSLAQVFENIEEPGSWNALYHLAPLGRLRTQWRQRSQPPYTPPPGF